MRPSFLKRKSWIQCLWFSHIIFDSLRCFPIHRASINLRTKPWRKRMYAECHGFLSLNCQGNSSTNLWKNPPVNRMNTRKNMRYFKIIFHVCLRNLKRKITILGQFYFFQKVCRMTSKFSIGDCAGGHRLENRDKNRDVAIVPREYFNYHCNWKVISQLFLKNFIFLFILQLITFDLTFHHSKAMTIPTT